MIAASIVFNLRSCLPINLAVNIWANCYCYSIVMNVAAGMSESGANQKEGNWKVMQWLYNLFCLQSDIYRYIGRLKLSMIG